MSLFLLCSPFCHVLFFSSIMLQQIHLLVSGLNIILGTFNRDYELLSPHIGTKEITTPHGVYVLIIVALHFKGSSEQVKI